MLLSAASLAGPRSSANYSITTDVADVGGARATSATYTNDGSATMVTGLSTAASPQEVARNGYAGQLYETKGFAISSASPDASVNETGTLQLAAFQRLDDASFIAMSANAVSWRVASGPIAGVSATGLLTAGVVYEDTIATVKCDYGGLSGMLEVTVLDSIPDNFGLYAGDQLGDDWQVRYFGLSNPQGAPGVDVFGTGQTNLFKFIAGLDPTDRNARFTMTIEPVVEQPGQMNVIFGPVVAGRNYVVMARTDLSAAGAWVPINASAPSDLGTQRTVTDLEAGGAVKFYHVEITKQ